MQLIKDLKLENSALTEIVLKQAGAILPGSNEEITITQIPESIRSIGKIPWYMRQRQLEQMHRKPKLNELLGVQGELDFAE